jgi:glycosyltransferase involved in cell wall biosynthesis
VIRLLQQADIFCYPTASEGFPKAVLEALACGLPVVTTRVSVLPKLIGTGCGLLLEHTNPEALAQAVLACLSDAVRYRTMSARAVETASQYSLERWRDTIGDLLRAACGPLRSDA